MKKEKPLTSYSVVDLLFDIVLEDIPYPEVTTLVYDGGWGKNGSVQLERNSTWDSIIRASDALVYNSGDPHHTFIQSYKKISPNTLKLYCGTRYEI